jgi:hypothetical protein
VVPRRTPVVPRRRPHAQTAVQTRKAAWQPYNAEQRPHSPYRDGAFVLPSGVSQTYHTC